MTATEMLELAQWLVDFAATRDAGSPADINCRATARVVLAIHVMQAAADVIPGWSWKCFLEPTKVRLEYGFWLFEGRSTPLEAIESAVKP